MSSLKGKVALITGASSGIGAATAIHFASLGCNVALSGRNAERLQTKSKLCEEAGLSPKQVLIAQGDISVEEEAVEIVRKTVAHFGKLDVLINNAGIVFRQPIHTAKLQELDDTFATNFKAAFHLIQLSIPHLKKTKGNIVNVSSVAACLPTSHSVVYGASKAALDHLTRSVALDLGPSGVRVNSVNPGFVETEIFYGKGMNDSEVKVFLDNAMSLHALNRISKPEEIAGPIAFLASDEASFITGVNLLIDGGLALKGAGSQKT